MLARRVAAALGSCLIGLTFLLANPHPAHSQDVTVSESARLSFGDAPRAVGWLNWNGIWVSSNGRWGWRPTRRPDWQAYFRCRMGYGAYAYGWNAFPILWPPGPYSSWDFGVGRWMGYPDARFHGAWTPWYLGPGGYPGLSFAWYRCAYPYDWYSFLYTGWGGGPTLAYGYPHRMFPFDPYRSVNRLPPFINVLGWLPPWTIDSRSRDRTGRPIDGPRRAEDGVGASEPEIRAFIDPVRTESFDRSAWLAPAESAETDPASRAGRSRIDVLSQESKPSSRSDAISPGSRPQTTRVSPKNDRTRVEPPESPSSRHSAPTARPAPRRPANPGPARAQPSRPKPPRKEAVRQPAPQPEKPGSKPSKPRKKTRT